MIAGAGNFPSGSSRCESFLFNPTIADEIAEPECGKGRKMRGRPANRAQTIFRRAVIDPNSAPKAWRSNQRHLLNCSGEITSREPDRSFSDEPAFRNCRSSHGRAQFIGGGRLRQEQEE
jgi:hypothetical protein